MAEHFTNLAEITKFTTVCNMGDECPEHQSVQTARNKDNSVVFLAVIFIKTRHMNLFYNIELCIRYISILHGGKTTDNGKLGLTSRLRTRVDV